MASLSRDANGTFRIHVFVSGKRKCVRLGKLTRKAADAVRLRVENMATAIASGLPLDTETAAWVGTIGDDLAGKLAKAGLIAARPTATLGGFLAEYVRRRKADGAKPNTVKNISGVVADLLDTFGADTWLRNLSAEQAERLKAEYQAKGLAGSTTHRQLKYAKMMFADAVRQKLIPENPFADVKAANNTTPNRRHYVSPDDAHRLIAASAPVWRVIIALSRFAGLRCPSEVLSLKWADVDLAAGRMVVTSPKTEHIEGKEYRVCPIFTALRPHLEEAFELATPGEVYVVGGPTGDGFRASAGDNWRNANLRTTMLKIVRRAGLVAWPKLFHNMRASCETDLMQNHPIHVVTAWIGNTPKIALTHYLQTLDADFEKASGAESGAQAAHFAAQQGAEPTGADGRNEGADGEAAAVRPEISGDSPLGSRRLLSAPSGKTTASFGGMLPAGVEPASSSL